MKTIINFYKKWDVVLQSAGFFLLLGTVIFLLPLPPEASPVVHYFPLAIGILGALVCLSPIVLLEPLIKSDLEDMREGRIWTPRGYKDISHISKEDRTKRYIEGSLVE